MKYLIPILLAACLSACGGQTNETNNERGDRTSTVRDVPSDDPTPTLRVRTVSPSPRELDGGGVQTPVEAAAPAITVQDVPEPLAVTDPPPAPTVVYVPPFASGAYPDVMVSIICAEGYAWGCEKALSVAWCEMGGYWNPAAINPLSGTRGVFQIHPTYHAHKWLDFWDAWSDPVRNTQMAYEIWSVQGWQPWACQ